jgi:hypothetical protein
LPSHSRAIIEGRNAAVAAPRRNGARTGHRRFVEQVGSGESIVRELLNRYFGILEGANELRRCGDVNFYIRAREYGFVEVAHLALCHAVLDVDMGWRPPA